LQKISVAANVSAVKDVDILENSLSLSIYTESSSKAIEIIPQIMLFNPAVIIISMSQKPEKRGTHSPGLSNSAGIKKHVII